MGKRHKRHKRHKHPKNDESNTFDALSVSSSDLHKHDAPDNKDKSNSSGREPNPSMGFVRIWWNQLTDSKQSNRIMAVFTIVIAITGIVYAVFAGEQWSSIDGQLTEMKNSNRPWVFTVPGFGFNPVPTLETLREIPVTVHIRNLGVSPAIHTHNSDVLVGLDTDISVVEHLKSCAFTYPDNYAGGTLQPNQSFQNGNGMTTRTQTRTLSEEERKQVVSHTKQLFVMGAVKYAGVRGGEFETKYCYIWNPDSLLNEHILPFGECRCNEMK